MRGDLSKQLSRSIAMVEMAAKKMYEKRTGRQVEVNATYTVNGEIKVKVVLRGVEAEDRTSSIYITQYLVNDMYIEEVTIPSIENLNLRTNDISFEWLDAYAENGRYNVVGEMTIGIHVELFKQRTNVISFDQGVHVKTYSGTVTLECMDCDFNWEEMMVA